MLALALEVTSKVEQRLRDVVEWLQAAAKAEVLPGVIAGVIAVVVVVVIARVWCIRRELAKRVPVAALAADEFDPSAEEVRQFARKLTRAARALTTRFLRPASGTRVRLESTPSGRMLYVIEVPAAGRSVVRTAMFSKVTLVDPGEVEGLAVLGGAGGGPAVPDPRDHTDEPDDDEAWPDEEPWT